MGGRRGFVDNFLTNENALIFDLLIALRIGSSLVSLVPRSSVPLILLAFARSQFKPGDYRIIRIKNPPSSSKRLSIEIRVDPGE